jgi:queuine tRNA-ribosyltransferase
MTFYTALETNTVARRGVIKVDHGVVETPVFMPVGTQGSVKALAPEDVWGLGAEIILGNTYHLYLRPGARVLETWGGLHEFMGWKGPLLTDSGGYQVSSLGLFQPEEKSRLSTISEEGVNFVSHIDGSRHFMTPEVAMEMQGSIGADIVMAFDEATPITDKQYARQAMERTHRWLKRSKTAFDAVQKKRGQVGKSRQYMFGIIQGGEYKDLRRESAKMIVESGVAGVAIGGASIGQAVAQTEEVVSWVRDLLPRKVPLYLMGVGVGPSHVIGAVEAGADMFDCVAPTKLARTGLLYSGNLVERKTGTKKTYHFESEFPKERLTIGKKQFEQDTQVISPGCGCYTCKSGFSRSYLHHLFKARELTYYRLASIHNVYTLVQVVKRLRG